MYHPGKTNVAVDALSKNFVGTLAAIAQIQPHLLHDLENLRARFIVWDFRVLLARLSVQSIEVKKIKLSQRGDP